MIYYSGYSDNKRKTAGSKAPADIQKLSKMRGYTFLPIPMPYFNNLRALQIFEKYLLSNYYWICVLKKLKRGDVLLYQHPLYVTRLLKRYLKKIRKKGIRTIVLIHDLETLRMGIEGAVKVNKKANEKIESELLKDFDVIICHNKKMKEYLISIGYSNNKLVELELFDYLSDFQPKVEIPKDLLSVMVAGNLLESKSGYIYHIFDNGKNKNLSLNLFGINYNNTFRKKQIRYYGAYSPEELTKSLVGSFGLVWDGPSAQTCSGNTGEYLRYNNPHKLSLYLSSGIPVIVWNKSAVADLVRRANVGITVNSLYDLEDILTSISSEEYAEMKKNSVDISRRLRNGEFFYSALDKALNIINGGCFEF